MICGFYLDREMLVYMLSCFSHDQLFVTPWTAAHQAPLFMRFSRQEFWNGLPFPSPRDLPDPGNKPGSPALWANSLPSEAPGKPNLNTEKYLYLCYSGLLNIYIFVFLKNFIYFNWRLITLQYCSGFAIH